MTLRSVLFKIAMVILIGLSGCETIDIRGHQVDADQLKKIQVGVTTKIRVRELLGSPSAVATFNNKTWFYISDTTSTRAFLSPVILKSTLVRIEFDKNDVVKSFDFLTEIDKSIVEHVHRSTPTAGHEFGVLEQIFGNVGRFNGKDPDMDRRGRR